MLPYRDSKPPRNLDDRYITEDIPYGLIPLAELGDCAGVETPNIDAIVTIGCAVTGRDLISEARRIKAIGWDNLSVEQIVARVE
jgi:opine dehydrogenase